MEQKVEENTTLLRKLETRNATIGVIGLGYVGLPLVRAICDVGFDVIGFDVDAEKISMLTRGQQYIRHLEAGFFKERIEEGRFRPTTDFALCAEADALLICVPTPLTQHREPDLSFVEDTVKRIASGQRRQSQLIVLESTTYPGTTREVVRPLLEQGGYVNGRDFFLAFSPEREDPGNADFSTSSIPKIVGGDGEEALSLALALYNQFINKTVPVSTTDTAEAVKITENIFRSVNIALVNELKLIYAAMGVDVWEVIEAAKTKPFGYMPFYPGPGLGGHCIPIDPFYLTWKAREFEIPTRFVELAGEINAGMPKIVVHRVAEELSSRFSKSIKGAKILLLGLSYKKNVDDIRESPSFKLIELLEAKGASVDFYDPYVPTIPVTREHAALAGRPSVSFEAETIAGYDAALISTDHDCVDYDLLVKNAKLIVDTRNVISRSTGTEPENLCKA